MVLVKRFMKILRIVLQSKYFYLCLLFISLIYLYIYSNIKYESKYDFSESYIIGKIDYYKIDGNKLTIDISSKEKIRGMFYFDNLDEKNDFINDYSFGDLIRVNGSLKLANNNTIFNNFNYKRYLHYNKIFYLIDIDNISIISKNKNIFIKMKNSVYKRLSLIDNEYIDTFIVGKSYKIDEESYNNYKINGVLHLFALSGMHVSILSAVLGFVLKKLKINKWVSFFILSFVLFFQAFIAFFSASIVRAVFLYIFKKIYEYANIRINIIYILLLVFCFMIFIKPFYFFDLGFQLSFILSFYIILFSNKFRINGKVCSLFFISVVSFLASFPLIIYNYYEINIVGLLNNIIFIPFVSSFVYPLSLITFIFPFCTIIFEKVIYILEYISSVSANILVFNVSFSKISLISLCLLYVFLLLYLIRKKYVYLLCYLIFCIYLYFVPFNVGDNYIYFLDVGQGDSILIVDENKKSIVIDTGGFIKYNNEEWKKKNREFNLIKNNIIPFYKSIGLKKIDYLIISHGDFDHMGETINLVNNFKVEKVIFNCGPYNNLEKDLIKVLDKNKIPYYSCIKELNIGNNKLYFLNNKDYGNENDNSSIIYTKLNNHKFLFMGDAGIEVEEDLIKKYNLQDIDVLKVGHHGSKTSSGKEFINEVNPKYSIISVGKNNRYGHPNDGVLENLKDSKIYRTDEAGSIMFKIKSNKLKIENCCP